MGTGRVLSGPEAAVSNLTGWPALIALGCLALVLAWSAVGYSDGTATLILFVLVALAIVASNG